MNSLMGTNSIQCMSCGKTFSQKYHLQRHIQFSCGHTEAQFTCKVCYKKFRRKDHLNRHFQTIHAGTYLGYSTPLAKGSISAHPREAALIFGANIPEGVECPLDSRSSESPPPEKVSKLINENSVFKPLGD